MFNFNFGDLELDVAEHMKGFDSTKMITSLLALLIIISIYRRGLRTPKLQGPRSESFIFGNNKKIFPSTNLAVVFQEWERTYGPVYEIPTGFGSNHVVLSDLKAITHLFSKDTTTYCLPARVSALACKLVSVCSTVFFRLVGTYLIPVWRSCSGRRRGDTQEVEYFLPLNSRAIS